MRVINHTVTKRTTLVLIYHTLIVYHDAVSVVLTQYNEHWLVADWT